MILKSGRTQNAKKEENNRSQESFRMTIENAGPANFLYQKICIYRISLWKQAPKSGWSAIYVKTKIRKANMMKKENKETRINKKEGGGERETRITHYTL